MSQELKTRLINGLDDIPLDWGLTPLRGNKSPYRSEWQHELPVAREVIKSDIQSGKCQGYGIRTGTISNGILAVDLDGASASGKLLELSSGAPLPKTVAFTSGRPGRCQLLFRVPIQYWDAIQTKKIKTGANGQDGKPEQVELRWEGCQSVLPASVHPQTGAYLWVAECAAAEQEIAEAPLWLIELMLKEVQASTDKANAPYQPRVQPLEDTSEGRWTDIDWALSYLGVLSSSRADDYQEWLAVGMALHSVDDSLLAEWDKWSQGSPKYKAGVCDKKWSSFKRSGVAMGSLGHMAKQDGWQSPFAKHGTSSSYQRQPNSEVSNTAKKTNNGSKPNAETKEIDFSDGVAEYVRSIIKTTSNPSERKGALLGLATLKKRSLREFEDFADLLEEELEQKEERESLAAEVDVLISAAEESIDIHSVLPEVLATPLKKMSAWLNLRPELYLTSLLTGVSTTHKVGTELIVNEAWDFETSPNLFSAIVAESSQKKSPVLKTVIYKPLRLLQAQAREEYEAAIQQYNVEMERYNSMSGEALNEAFPNGKPKEPRQKVYFMSATSGEGLMYQMAAHPSQGLLYVKDELAGILKSPNQYRNGRGSDEEDLLSFYDGHGGTIIRANGVRADIDNCLLGMLGSIQPTVLQEFMKDCLDGNGKWARFIFISQPLAPSQMNADDGSLNITELLADLYRKVDSLPPTTYRLDHEAFACFCEAYNRLEQLRVNDPSQGMRAVWGKTPGRIAKLATNLHVIQEVMANRQPRTLISKDRVAEAVKLAWFYANQVKALHVGFSEPDNVASHLAKIIALSKKKGWIKAKDVQQGYNSSNRPAPILIRAWFSELKNMGKGVTRGAGNSLHFNHSGWTTSPPPESTAESLINKGINNNSGLNGLVDYPPSFTGKEEAVDMSTTENAQKEVLNVSIKSTSPPVHQNGQNLDTASISQEDLRGGLPVPHSDDGSVYSIQNTEVTIQEDSPPEEKEDVYSIHPPLDEISTGILHTVDMPLKGQKMIVDVAWSKYSGQEGVVLKAVMLEDICVCTLKFKDGWVGDHDLATLVWVNS